MVNGGVPASDLVVVDEHGTRLLKWVAAVWARAVADAAKDGVTLAPSYTPPPAPAGMAGYRDYDMQLWLYRHPIGPVRINPPGTSTHGLGDVLDVGEGLAWLVPRLGAYGMSRPLLGRGEPWHIQFRTSLAGLGLTPIIEKKGVRPMFRAALRDTQRVAFFDSISFYETTEDSVDDKAWSRFVGKPGLTVTQAEWDSYRAVAASNAAKLGTSGTAGGVSLTEVRAEADRVIAKVPTAGQNGAASRAAMIKD